MEDDEAQTERAAALIEAAVAADERLYVSDIVLCEVVRVLVGAYGFRRLEVAEVLSELTRARHLRFDSSDRIARWVRAFESGRGDFAHSKRGVLRCDVRSEAPEARGIRLTVGGATQPIA